MDVVLAAGSVLKKRKLGELKDVLPKLEPDVIIVEEPPAQQQQQHAPVILPDLNNTKFKKMMKTQWILQFFIQKLYVYGQSDMKMPFPAPISSSTFANGRGRHQDVYTPCFSLAQVNHLIASFEFFLKTYVKKS